MLDYSSDITPFVYVWYTGRDSIEERLTRRGGPAVSWASPFSDICEDRGQIEGVPARRGLPAVSNQDTLQACHSRENPPRRARRGRQVRLWRAGESIFPLPRQHHLPRQHYLISHHPIHVHPAGNRLSGFIRSIPHNRMSPSGELGRQKRLYSLTKHIVYRQRHICLLRQRE